MIYMVEMEFRDPEREHDWHVWYLQHVTQLIRNVPGFTATQRFRSMTPTPSPWLAMHEVAGPEVFTSAEYGANGGPASTGEWKDRHSNWYRNLFSGIDQTPDVGADQFLLMAEAGAKLSAATALGMIEVTGIGLDKTAEKRRFKVVGWSELKAGDFASPGLRIFKPISPKVRK